VNQYERRDWGREGGRKREREKEGEKGRERAGGGERGWNRETERQRESFFLYSISNQKLGTTDNAWATQIFYFF
jgi:hypothetical protein